MKRLLLILALLCASPAWAVKVYVQSHTLSGTGYQMTYYVHDDAGTTISGQLTWSATSQYLNKELVKAAVFAEAKRFESALDAEDRLSTYAGNLYNVTDSPTGGKIYIHSVQRTTDSATLSVVWDARQSNGTTVVYGPSEETFSSPAKMTMETIKRTLFLKARQVEAAITTRNALNSAISTEVTVR